MIPLPNLKAEADWRAWVEERTAIRMFDGHQDENTASFEAMCEAYNIRKAQT